MSGSRGPVSKSPSDKQSRRTGIVAPMAKPAALNRMPAAPAAPKGLRERSRVLWDDVWNSPVSATWNTAMDLAVVERYVTYFDEWLVATRALRNGNFTTTGSQGQDVISPAVSYARQLESQLTKLESQLGLTPMARARLGLTIEEAKLTAQQANQMMTPNRRTKRREEEEEEEEHDEEDVDDV